MSKGSKYISGGVDSYSNVNANPNPQQRHAQVKRDWHYGMCDCGNTGACCESFWCTTCQASRQVNMMLYNDPTHSCALCCAASVVDELGGGDDGTSMLVCYARSLARKRYGIAGSNCGDCCASCCCTCCVVNQVLREMTLMSECPGATCCVDVSEGVAPHSQEMQ